MKLDLPGQLKYDTGWQPAENWKQFLAIDAHTAGEPLRIIISGYPELGGKTILDNRRYIKDNLDHFRQALMWEPRGHADMYGCILTEPETPGADFGLIFLHNEGYSTMCGHAIIAVTKVLLQLGMLPVNEPETCLKIDTPAGMVTSFARVNRGKVESVYFHNVPSFVYAEDRSIEIPGIGSLRYDVAFGGAFYAFADARSAGVVCLPEDFRNLILTGLKIKQAVSAELEIKHPFHPELGFLYGTIFLAEPLEPGSDSRNICVFADGEVDRSPTGTGVSARMALHYHKQEMGLNDKMVIESIIGTKFTGSIKELTVYGDYEAVIPRVEGNAYITGMNNFYLDPEDPLRYGFILR